MTHSHGKQCIDEARPEGIDLVSDEILLDLLADTDRPVSPMAKLLIEYELANREVPIPN